MFVDSIPDIKQLGLNAVSIRDSEDNRDEKMRNAYATIDSAGLENLYVVAFDDLAKPLESKYGKGLIFPDESHIIGILEWAKQKWAENGKHFVVHCSAGVSRSAAVAMLINQMIINDYRAGWNIDRHSPNQKVLELGEEYLDVPSFKDVVHDESIEHWRKKWEDEEYPNPF